MAMLVITRGCIQSEPSHGDPHLRRGDLAGLCIDLAAAITK